MRKLVFALLALALIAPALRAEGYVQPSVGYMFIGGSRENAFGFGLATGWNFNRYNAIEIEAARFLTKDSESGSGYDTKFERTIIPILGSYRFTIPLNQEFAFFVAVLAGITEEKFDSEYRAYPAYGLPGYYWSYSDTFRPFTWGGQIGCTYEFTDNATALFAVKVMRKDRRGYDSGENLAILQFGGRYSF